jgi:putative transposase
MIDRSHDLPLSRQANLLQLSRSNLYYTPRPVPAADLAIMRRIDALHLDYPFAGSRMLRDLLRSEAVAIGRDRVATMMRRMGIEALYRRPSTSKPAPGHKIYPFCCAAWRSSDRTKCGRGWPRFQRRSRWNSQTRSSAVVAVQRPLR